MKALVLLVFLALVSTGCHRSADSENSKKLEGIWVVTSTSPDGVDFKSSTKVDKDGNYVANLLVRRESGAQTFQIRGTMVISNEVVVDTMTQHTSTNATNLPITYRPRIVRFTDDELVVNYGEGYGLTNEVVMRKESKQR